MPKIKPNDIRLMANSPIGRFFQNRNAKLKIRSDKKIKGTASNVISPKNSSMFEVSKDKMRIILNSKQKTLRFRKFKLKF